jgi:hypothetical protein
MGPNRNSMLKPGAGICKHAYMGMQQPDGDRKIAIQVLLRLTRMDVCCGPPQQ